MVANAVVKVCSLQGQRQQAVLQARHRHACNRVHMQHTVRIVTRVVDGGVDVESSRVDGVFGGGEHMAITIDANQIGCGDF